MKTTIRHIVNYLRNIDQLQKTILGFYIQRNKVTQEKTLNRHTTTVMRSLSKIRLSLGNGHVALLASLEHVYEILFSLDLLKHRITDYATFEICEKEFCMISSALSSVFIGLTKNKLKNESIDDPIRALEYLYQQTLQVVVSDPMVFLFFIRDLYTLQDEITFLATEINELRHEK